MTLGPVIEDSIYVTEENGPRPAGRPDRCFYCGHALGDRHKDDCVCVVRHVRIRLTVEYNVEVPADWDEGMILFHRNEGTWCASNFIDELDKRFGDESDACMCGAAHIDVIEWNG